MSILNERMQALMKHTAMLDLEVSVQAYTEMNARPPAVYGTLPPGRDEPQRKPVKGEV